LILENIICNNSITFLADLGELVQDSEFLNSLQNGVNRWVEAIRKVTRIDRDPSSGTALQEATFWMNFERALGRVNEIRESDEVIVTLEALKAGKRFHAFVTFNSDTGKRKSSMSQSALKMPLTAISIC
jgi:dynein heavy chain 1, cytosolic